MKNKKEKAIRQFKKKIKNLVFLWDEDEYMQIELTDKPQYHGGGMGVEFLCRANLIRKKFNKLL